MDSRLNHQIAAIRIAEARAQAGARAARRDVRPGRAGRNACPRASRRFAHR